MASFSQMQSQLQSQMQSQGLALPLEHAVGRSVACVSTKGSCVDPSPTDLEISDSDKCGLYIEENPSRPAIVSPAKPPDRSDPEVDDPLYLMTLTIPQLFLKPLQVMWDAIVFGVFNPDFPLYIKHEDLSEIAHGDQCLSISRTSINLITGGAHTIGFSRCNQSSKRIYNFKRRKSIDHTLNPAYAKQLKQVCPKNVDPRLAIDIDPVTPRTFDNQYYKNLQQGRGLLASDQALFTHKRTRDLVNLFASNNTAFEASFVSATTKLGRIGVKTGNQGEIRRDSTMVNRATIHVYVQILSNSSFNLFFFF
eukprot:XP_014622240.1 peroxidase 56-like [Glycine max]